MSNNFSTAKYSKLVFDLKLKICNEIYYIGYGYFVSPCVTRVDHVGIITFVEEKLLANRPNSNVTGMNSMAFADCVSSHQRDDL
jgi:hypothetical protein